MKKKRFRFFTFIDLKCKFNELMKMKLISFLLMFGLMQAFAVPPNMLQQGVSGKVTDADGNGIPGVTVVVKGTTSGTITNTDGVFELPEANQNDILVFSFVGKITVERTVTSTVVDVTMEDDRTELDEIVVIGYGTIRKSDLTGSVGTISSEELTSVPVTSISEGLQGRLAGVAITSNSSAPGGGISVKIRGNTSILNGSEPLYVIDGFPITGESQFNTSQGIQGLNGDGSSGAESDYTIPNNPLAALDPADIESIEVLKDASACAIYGVRGANGVILITTKRGKAGKPRIYFNSYVGVQSITKKIDMMNAEEYMSTYNEAEVNGGGTPIFTGQAPFDTDWQDLVYRTAYKKSYQLGVSGGSETIQYNISGSFYDQEGIIKNSGFKRYSLRSNIDVQATKRLKIGNSLSISRAFTDAAFVQGESNDGVSGQALAMSPLLDVYEADGLTYSGDRNMSDFGITEAEGERNPIATMNERSDKEVTTRILGTLFGEYSITDDIKFRISLGADIEKRDRHVYQTDKMFYNGNNRATVSGVHRSSFLNENTLNYNKTFDKHTIGLLGGFTVQEEIEEYSRIVASGFATNATTSYDIGSGTDTPVLESGYAGFSIASLIGRATYNYDNRYLLTATIRRDGSSKFAKNNKWATFPSVAGAWRINNEAFLADVDVLSNLKLRAGYGVVGNQELDAYGSLALLQPSNYNFNDGTLVNGFAPFRVPVNNLTWETTNQVNIGLDLSFMNSRINLTGDYYIKKTKDLLLAVTLPQTSGITEPSIQNIGEMENIGWELAIDGTIISTSDFSWNLGVNLSANKNEVTSLGDQNIYGDLSFPAPVPTYSGGTVLSRVTVGHPVGVFYGYKYDDLVRSEAEAEALQDILPGIEPGSASFVDKDGDGDIDAEDRTELGSPFPDLIYGISTNLKYKNFELRMFFQGQKGGQVYNMLRRFNNSPNRGHNMIKERSDSWSASNPGAKWPMLNRGTAQVGGTFLGMSDFYLEDATYLRMREITLSYYLPETLFGGVVGGSVYVTGQNLFTITDYTGYNPDTNGRAGNNVTYGIDASPYPLSKAFIIGLKLNF